MQEELKKELLKKDFYFDLPPELIAQDPLADRSASRLLVLDKKTGAVAHRKFTDIVEYLNEGGLSRAEQHQSNSREAYGDKGRDRGISRSLGPASLAYDVGNLVSNKVGGKN